MAPKTTPRAEMAARMMRAERVFGEDRPIRLDPLVAGTLVVAVIALVFAVIMFCVGVRAAFGQEVPLAHARDIYNTAGTVEIAPYSESVLLAQYEGYGFQQGGYDGYFPGARQKPREGGFPFPGPYYGPSWRYICGPYGCGYVPANPEGQYPVYQWPDGEYGYGESD